MFWNKNKNSENVCALCRFARTIDDSDNVLCTFKGVVKNEGTCRKFKYDFLKHDPGKRQTIDSLEFIDIDK